MIDIFRRVSKTVIVVFVCVLSLCGVLRAQWIDVTPDSDVQYNQIIFVDSLHGYIAANDVQYTDTSGAILFVTTDGGKSWKEDKIDVPWFSSISAIGDSLVWASSYKMVCHSRDGGGTWQFDTIGNFWFVPLTVQFVDKLNGWTTVNYQNFGFGEYEAIYHSSDGGLTWQMQYADSGFSDESHAYIRKGYFIDSLHGWVADLGGVLQTSDGGTTWTTTGPASDYGYCVYFINALRGWSGGEPDIYWTTDGGSVWTIGYDFHGPMWTSIYFVDSLAGWACDNYGGIVFSSDGGVTWNIQRPDDSLPSPGLNSIFFLDKNSGWAVGNGVILHTTNGGVTAVKERSAKPTTFAQLQNYPNPFNPSTTISYELSANSLVTLKIYDILGRQIATLVDGKQTAGVHTVTWNASAYASGVYFYKLISLSGNQRMERTNAMALIK